MITSGCYLISFKNKFKKCVKFISITYLKTTAGDQSAVCQT